MSFSWEIKLKGFGPFATQAGGTLTLSNSRIAIYSGNGQGKTCISRLFRAADNDAGALAGNIINRTEDAGSFSFVTSNQRSQPEKLHITMERGKDVIVRNDTGYIFHVFNSDYIRDNLGALHYAPNGDGFTGYIIGRDNIDVSDKREQLSGLSKRGQEIRAAIDKVVAEGRTTLADYELTRYRGYSELTVENILAMDSCSSEYESKLAEFEALRGLPDPIPVLAGINCTAGQVDLDSIGILLTQPFSRDKFADEFVAEVQPKMEFVKNGLDLTRDNRCPYCGMVFDGDAKTLIHNYEEYVRGAEAKTVSEIEGHIRTLNTLCDSYERFASLYRTKRIQFDSLKSAFPDLSEATLADVPTFTEIKASTSAVSETLRRKIADISLTYDVAPVTQLKTLLDTMEAAVADTENTLSRFDGLAANASKAIKSVKRDLCVEMTRKIRVDCDSLISARESILQAYRQLDADIKAEEVKFRRPKRAAIAQMLAKMIHEVFGDKYVFDSDQFTISLGDSPLGEDAEDVMSDGEKSALAFCHYVASTWNLLESDDDAQNLFFVIDDPISSLDYHYVYSILQIIRDFNITFGLKRVRFLLLTHSSAFFNMLARNGVVKECFVLHVGVIKPCVSHYITPYSEHLKDLVEIALGTRDPSHTTGNSIRQIIESLWRFDNPASTDLLAYLNTQECAALKDCEYIYSICQDQSHGASLFDRDQPPDDESIRRACWAVLNHVHGRYPGQLIASSIDFETLAQQQGDNDYSNFR